ncbi:MAG TPA: Jag N-terminal domain-containing protein [Candidatus Faecousia intestinigallinarum]|nr:Jag N-terminal domain-containing protein [Candidatus Faecousia intestinigallinarum]
MEKTIVTTGKTIDLAIEAALAQLGLDRDSVSVQVLAQAKTGFLGFGAQPAKVQVTYEAPDPAPAPEAPKTALSAASRSKKKPAEALRKPQPAEKPAAAPDKPAKPQAAPAKAEKPQAAQAQAEKPKEAPAKPKKEREPRAAEAPKAPKVYVPAEPGSVEEKIEQFLSGLMTHMGSQAVPHAWKEEDGSYQVDMVGDDLGYLIGRRGDTLDAIQHLCNYAVNREVDGHVRIHVDAEEYRRKREESLRRYARKKAQQVLKQRRRTTLEPMNAYERHVIHAALQDMDNIMTHSTGTEPNRRVVIEYQR